MLLLFQSDFLSISRFDPIELPDFTIITGLNGSGKTHLLQAISANHIDIEINGNKNNDYIYFDYNSFILKVANDNNRLLIRQDKSKIENSLNHQKNLILSHIMKIEEKVKNDENENEIYKFLIKEMYDNNKMFIDNILPLEFLITKMHKERNSLIVPEKFISLYNEIKTIFISLMENKEFMKYYNISKINNIRFNQLNIELCMYNENYLGQLIEDEFKKYRQLQFSNDCNYGRKQRGEEVEYFDNEEFNEKYGIPPWDFFNMILREYKCNNYFINDANIPYPAEFQNPNDFHINIHLKKKENNRYISIPPNLLSSGEKTLLALSTIIYRQKKTTNLPKVLLLDEIDSNLHPSMIKQMLDVINNIFIKEYDMKIIMVTHSPTTIALSNEDSIYVKSMDNYQFLLKKTKEEALSILTEGYATLERGIKLFDQIARTKVSIISEGDNIDYIKKALELYDIKDIGYIEDVKSCSGKNCLKVFYDFISRIKHDNKIIFIFDCDVTTRYEDKNNTFVYIYEKNVNNQITEKGIENLFAEELFEEFIFTTKDSKGKIEKRFDSSRKKDFLNFIMIRNNKEDFINFKSMIEKIESIKNMN